MIDEVILKTGGLVDTEVIETQRAHLPPAARKKSERHRRAKRTMIIVTVLCLALGSAPVAEQAIRHGWHAFVDRAPGVGGTPSSPDEPSAEVGNAPATPAHGSVQKRISRARPQRALTR